MSDGRQFVKMACEEFLSTYLRADSLEKALVHTPGCIVKKGPEKQYAYYQYRVNRRQCQRYLPRAEVEAVRQEIVRLKDQKNLLRYLKGYIKELARALRALRVDWRNVVAEYEERRRRAGEAAAKDGAARAIAAKKPYPENYKHRSDKGDYVASKSELVIANELNARGISYEYERGFRTARGQVLHPDFSIFVDGKMFIWEHEGLLEKESYRISQDAKIAAYGESGFVQGKNLILTHDENGVLNVSDVRRMIRTYNLDRLDGF